MKKTKEFLFYFFLMLFVVSAGLVFSNIKANAENDPNRVGEFKAVDEKTIHVKDKKTIAVKVGENDKKLDITITETDSESREGKSNILRVGKTIPVKVGEKYKLLDIALTEPNTETLITLKNESIIVLGGLPKSKLLLKEYLQHEEEKDKFVFTLPYGEMRAMTCIDRFQVESPLAVVNAFGTLDFSIWESTLDGKPASCVAVLKGGVVEIKNIDPSIKDVVKVPKGEMSCVAAGEVPSSPITIPEEFINVLIAKGNRTHIADHSCKPCLDCERLNPEGVCVPDNFKPCDDGDSCTIDDRCLGRKCKGKKDPSSVDPNCSFDQ